MQFQTIADEFVECHREPLNVMLHIITTSGFYISVFGLLGNYAFMIYTLFMLALPFKRLALVMMMLVLQSYLGALLTFEQNIALFLVSYVGQDLSHYFCSEPTYQSLYTPKDYSFSKWLSFLGKLSLHTFYMLPLVVESAFRCNLLDHALSWLLVPSINTRCAIAWFVLISLAKLPRVSTWMLLPIGLMRKDCQGT
jgi:hypothetical protein